MADIRPGLSSVDDAGTEAAAQKFKSPLLLKLGSTWGLYRFASDAWGAVSDARTGVESVQAFGMAKAVIVFAATVLPLLVFWLGASSPRWWPGHGTPRQRPTTGLAWIISFGYLSILFMIWVAERASVLTAMRPDRWQYFAIAAAFELGLCALYFGVARRTALDIGAAGPAAILADDMSAIRAFAESPGDWFSVRYAHAHDALRFEQNRIGVLAVGMWTAFCLGLVVRWYAYLGAPDYPRVYLAAMVLLIFFASALLVYTWPKSRISALALVVLLASGVYAEVVTGHGLGLGGDVLLTVCGPAGAAMAIALERGWPSTDGDAVALQKSPAAE